jgi:hypothetical protein
MTYPPYLRPISDIASYLFGFTLDKLLIAPIQSAHHRTVNANFKDYPARLSYGQTVSHSVDLASKKGGSI